MSVNPTKLCFGNIIKKRKRFFKYYPFYNVYNRIKTVHIKWNGLKDSSECKFCTCKPTDLYVANGKQLTQRRQQRTGIHAESDERMEKLDQLVQLGGLHHFAQISTRLGRCLTQHSRQNTVALCAKEFGRRSANTCVWWSVKNALWEELQINEIKHSSIPSLHPCGQPRWSSVRLAMPIDKLCACSPSFITPRSTSSSQIFSPVSSTRSEHNAESRLKTV